MIRKDLPVSLINGLLDEFNFIMNIEDKLSEK